MVIDAKERCVFCLALLPGHDDTCKRPPDAESGFAIHQDTDAQGRDPLDTDFGKPTAIRLVTKPTVNDEIKASVIKFLRKALEQAEAGDVAGAILTIRRPNGFWSHDMTQIADFPDAIGRLEIVKQCWIASYVADEQEEV